MIKKEIAELYGKDIFRLHSLEAIRNLIKHRRDNNLSLDKIIIKQKLIELKKYSQINHCRMTLERYIIIYDYYGQREYKKYNKRKTSEFIKPIYNHKKDSKSLNYFKRKYGDNELAVQKYEENCKNILNNTKIEYYLQNGMSYEEACKARSERQRTFSLEICQKKFGEQKGKEVWEARQQKWQNTLNSKSEEEINDINRRKCEWLKDEDKLAKANEKHIVTLNKIKEEDPELYQQIIERKCEWLKDEDKLAKANEKHIVTLNKIKEEDPELYQQIIERKCEWLKDEDKVAEANEKRIATMNKIKEEDPELYYQKFTRCSEWTKDKDKLARAVEKGRETREKLKKENPELYHQKFDRLTLSELIAKETEGYLYYIHIYNDDVNYYKIGITKYSNIKYRFSINKFKENHFNFDVIFFKKCNNYKDAYMHEQNILHKFGEYRIFVDYGFFKSSEVFDRDVFEGKYDEINI